MPIYEYRCAACGARFEEFRKMSDPPLDECIECGACIPECPVEAIFPDTEVPEGEEAWIDRNAEEAIDAPIAEGDSPVLGD